MPENLMYSIEIKKWLVVIGITFGLFMVLFFFNPIVIIGAGERGVVLEFGAVQNRIMQEGLNFIVPIKESVVKVDVKTQKYQTEASSASKDLQIVTSLVAVNYHLEPSSVNWLYQNIGTNYRGVIIEPSIQEAVKASTAKYTAEELITERPLVRDLMIQKFREKMSDLSKGSVVVEEFNIIDFDFSPEFNDAIEKKVTAEQRALEEQWNLERVKFEAQQQIEKAKAEAEALALQKEALMEAPELIELRRVERDKKAIEKWDGKLPQWVSSGGIPFINVGSAGE